MAEEFEAVKKTRPFHDFYHGFLKQVAIGSAFFGTLPAIAAVATLAIYRTMSFELFMPVVGVLILGLAGVAVTWVVGMAILDHSED